ncbi:hypothetical protein ACFSSA_01450 [Luteolibacter algae]|uniref:Uncharacterized protein n=1 Tax=Luteolibacter algae TaxID=454151 RepID=A0ABW5D2V4_9BACT
MNIISFYSLTQLNRAEESGSSHAARPSGSRGENNVVAGPWTGSAQGIPPVAGVIIRGPWKA